MWPVTGKANHRAFQRDGVPIGCWDASKWRHSCTSVSKHAKSWLNCKKSSSKSCYFSISNICLHCKASYQKERLKEGPRVDIGKSFQRWRELHHMMVDSEIAILLLNSVCMFGTGSWGGGGLGGAIQGSRKRDAWICVEMLKLPMPDKIWVLLWPLTEIQDKTQLAIDINDPQSFSKVNSVS